MNLSLGSSSIFWKIWGWVLYKCVPYKDTNVYHNTSSRYKLLKIILLSRLANYVLFEESELYGGYQR